MSSVMTLPLTMLAPIIWGTTYLVTSEWLPEDYPITIAMLRALPAGVLILILLRQWPPKNQWLKVFILGGLNFTVFWICLFIAAYRLPGGIAATLGALQPLMVIGLAYGLFNNNIKPLSIVSAVMGVAGVALLVLKSTADLDGIGVVAALVGAASMALGTVLSKQWRSNSSLLAFTGWQLTAGGLLLLPLALYLEPNFPVLNMKSVSGLLWLGLVGALLSYILWFNGVTKLNPVQVSTLGFLSPVTAIVLGWLVLGQNLSTFQLIGVVIIFISILVTSMTEEKPV
ncbi:MAG: EamA family transporter [Cellvibrionaceae bacterium]